MYRFCFQTELKCAFFLAIFLLLPLHTASCYKNLFLTHSVSSPNLPDSNSYTNLTCWAYSRPCHVINSALYRLLWICLHFRCKCITLHLITRNNSCCNNSTQYRPPPRFSCFSCKIQSSFKRSKNIFEPRIKLENNKIKKT